MMKNFNLSLLIISLVLCFASCGEPSAVSPSITDAIHGDTQLETTQTLDIPSKHYDELWPNTLNVDFEQSQWKGLLGKEFEVIYEFYKQNSEAPYEDYDYEFTVSDPTVAEVIAYGYDNYVLYDGSMSAVRLKGLKEGTIWLEMKMIHKATGGVCCIYTSITITTPTETTDENEFDQWYNELESGEWPDACSIGFDSLKDISIEVDEIYEVPYMGFTLNADRYQAKYQQGNDYYQIDIVVDDSEILEVVDIDKEKLMDDEAGGGLTLKGLAPGETTVTLTMTYLPTGGTHSTSTVISVIIEAETTK